MTYHQIWTVCIFRFVSFLTLFVCTCNSAQLPGWVFFFLKFCFQGLDIHERNRYVNNNRQFLFTVQPRCVICAFEKTEGRENEVVEEMSAYNI